MFKAYSSRGNNSDVHDNKILCLEILKLRAEKAALLGFDSFAAYQLDDKMAKDPAAVDSFLDRIIGPAVHKAQEEMADMQKVMDRDIKAGLDWDGIAKSLTIVDRREAIRTAIARA